MITSGNKKQGGVPKYLQISAQIEALVRSGQLAPGEKLFSEKELASQFNVTPVTVSRGLKGLVEKGLLVRKSGSGTYVSTDTSVGTSIHSDNSRKLLVCVRSGSVRVSRFEEHDVWLASLRQAFDSAAATFGVGVYYDYVSNSRYGRIDPSELGHLCGVIALPTFDINPMSLFEGVSPKTPKILINRPSALSEIPSVYIDQEVGAFEATSLLLRLGHRRICLFFGDQGGEVVMQRVNGYKKAFEKAGVEVDPQYILTEMLDDYYSKWPEWLDKILKHQRPTAILMNNLGVARHVVNVLQQAELKIPEDISLIFFDDSSSLRIQQPTLSCVRQPVREMVELAMERLIQLHQGAKGVQIKTSLHPELLIRDSVSIPPRD